MNTLNAADILRHRSKDPSIPTWAEDMLLAAMAHVLAQRKGVERISVQVRASVVGCYDRPLKEGPRR